MLLCSLVLQKSIYLFNMVQFNNFNILHLSLKPHDHMIYCEYFSISSYLNILCKCCLIFDEFHRLKLSFTPLQEFCCMLKKCLTLWVQVFTFAISISLSLNSLSAQSGARLPGAPKLKSHQEEGKASKSHFYERQTMWHTHTSLRVCVGDSNSDSVEIKMK